ncbi:MAG: LAGLIDADG family homing endonuclease [Acidimicrobiia bacterium]
MQEVVGSSPISSTDLIDQFHRVWRSIGFTLGGFVAGEGWFGTKRRAEAFVRDGSPRLTFGFSVVIARRDRHVLEALACFLGVGSIHDTPARQAHHQPLSEFSISSLRVHHAVTIPFAETFLLPCAKRRQFEAWRDSMAAYEARRPSQHGRGRSQCSVDGCTAPVRGRSLCRSHYYRATGY